MPSLLEHNARVVAVIVNRITLVVFGKQIFDFPIVLLLSDGEFEIFFCDRIPVLQPLLAQVALFDLLE